jgi:hypothetical protein
MSIETTTKLATVTVGAGGIASVSFSNIPQTYTDLKLVVSARSTRNNATYPVDNLNIAFNGASAGVSVAQRSLYTYEATGSQIIASGNDTYLNNFMIKADGGTASTFSSGEVYVSNYTSSNVKPISMDSVAENNSTKAWLMFNAGVSLITAPITSIQMYALSGNLVQHSTFTLYGVKAMRTAVGSSIKATGGTISFDGTYVTHTFNSTGLFTPTQSLIADYLVVAGGGGGGSSNNSGGGGAGGLRSTVTATGGGGSLEATLSLTGGIGYAVTIGAGGAGGVGSNVTGTSGGDSGFSSIVATGGGGGGGENSNGAAGGSSGGGGYNGNAGTRTASPVQGTNGANGSLSAPYPAGGGGGAGAAGSGAQGGNGQTISITGSSITYGGGGSGGRSSTPVAGGTGGGGSGGQNGGTAPTAGTVNLGGGGGGGAVHSGAAGGSGIVVIRYKA